MTCCQKLYHKIYQKYIQIHPKCIKTYPWRLGAGSGGAAPPPLGILFISCTYWNTSWMCENQLLVYFWATSHPSHTYHCMHFDMWPDMRKMHAIEITLHLWDTAACRQRLNIANLQPAMRRTDYAKIYWNCNCISNL